MNQSVPSLNFLIESRIADEAECKFQNLSNQKPRCIQTSQLVTVVNYNCQNENQKQYISVSV